MCLSLVGVEYRSLTLIADSDLDEEGLKAMYLAKLAYDIRRMGWKAYKAKHPEVFDQFIDRILQMRCDWLNGRVIQSQRRTRRRRV
jgi:hypothetical protein